jgi:hypothetical protein
MRPKPRPTVVKGSGEKDVGCYMEDIPQHTSSRHGWGVTMGKGDLELCVEPSSGFRSADHSSLSGGAVLWGERAEVVLGQGAT